MYYHGTDISSVQNILKMGFIKPSTGDNHWLGDGCYFYKDEEYAFRWILMKYTDNFRNQSASDYDGIYHEYMILAAEMNQNMRIFSMENINNKLYFIKMKSSLQEKAEYSERFGKQLGNKGIVDGVVFNVMFEEMGLSEDFDAVEAVFPIMLVQGNSRLDYLPEVQLCIRRQDVIDKICQYSGESVSENYKYFMNQYNRIKLSFMQKKRGSRGNKTGMYQKHFRPDGRHAGKGRQKDGFGKEI